MPLWRCPHCATPQPESSRCWLCKRSTTTCAACRHYRRGVAGGLGLCGKNPRRLALRGTEVLPCWEALVTAEDLTSIREPGAALRGRGAPAADERPPRTFVQVDELRVTAADDRAAPAGQPLPPAPGTPRWSLWGDPEA